MNWKAAMAGALKACRENSVMAETLRTRAKQEADADRLQWLLANAAAHERRADFASVIHDVLAAGLEDSP